MLSHHDVIKSLLRTEKGTALERARKYLFLVHNESNKIQIKAAIEALYKVKVQDVNTLIMRGKMKRVRYQVGKTTDFKKAIVTLTVGQKIETGV